MMPMLSLQNFFSWAAQVSVLALTGALLPAIFRIGHPRSHLVYCYVLLLACIALPLIQPWQHPVASDSIRPNTALPDVQKAAKNTAGPGVARHWEPIVGWILLAGIVAKLCRFFIGFCQICHYRSAAVPLKYFPESVRLALKLTGRSSVVCISAGNIGPVTLGLVNPIVLLPESFLGLRPDAQCAIVCHELLHVKRNDWIVTVIEELVGACLWFHPAVWWLLSQTKLAREQIVDAEVIRLTAEPDPYINALLAMSGAHPDGALLPAPLFVYKRHLVRRLRSLLVDSPVSTLRLISSYASMAAVLAVTGCVTLTSFPLMGQPRIQETDMTKSGSDDVSLQPATSVTATQHGALQGRVFRVGGGVTAPKLITEVDPEYSDAAREALTQGIVVVQGIVQTDGTMSVTRVARSLDPELDHNAINAIKQWRFEPGKLQGAPVPVELDVQLSFNLKP
jgi:TonB family protein